MEALLAIAQIPLVASRHDKHDVSCVLRRACSNMADDEEAVVLTYKTISCFIIILLFQLTNEINSFIEKIRQFSIPYIVLLV